MRHPSSPNHLPSKESRSAGAKLADFRVQIVVALIEANYHRKLSLTEMAGTVNLSIWRLAHVFKSEVGVSLEAYLALVRLTHAKVHLATSFRSVKEIAALVGIPDVSNFAKFFKNNYGLTPTEYRAACHPARYQNVPFRVMVMHNA